MKTRFPPRRILVPMDFSPASDSALEAARTLGGLFDARLDLVHVREIAAAPVGAELAGAAVALAAAAREEAAEARAARRRLCEEGAGYPEDRLRTRVLVGVPAEALRRLSTPRLTDMVVMGTHGYKGVERALYGSVAEAVVRHASVPVLTVHRRRARFAVKHVLCPVNLTTYAASSLSYAALFAQAMGATLTALYVRPEEQWQPDARLELEAFVRRTLGKGGRQVERLAVSGEARERIAREAEQGPYDLVVLSEHLRPWSADRLVGTTAERVLRRSAVPLLAVPCPRSPRRRSPPAVWPTPREQALF